jgi:hypothetical protein
MAGTRLLEPHVELGLYDAEHVLLRVFGRHTANGLEVELVLEDAVLAELERERHRRRCTNEQLGELPELARLAVDVEALLLERPDLLRPFLDGLKQTIGRGS